MGCGVIPAWNTRVKQVPRGILEVNAPLIEEHARHRALVHRDAAEQVAARAYSAARLLVAVSPDVADYLATYPGLETRVQVIPNGVDPNRFPPRASRSGPPRAMTVPSPSASWARSNPGTDSTCWWTPSLGCTSAIQIAGS